MKKLVIILFTSFGMLWPATGFSQAQEMKQLMLNIEKLAQFRQILKDMKKGYEILNGGYNTIKDLSEGNFNLHKTFLDALFQISPAVRNYKRVGGIIDYQISLVREYNSALERFMDSGSFNDQELAYIDKVYDNLLKQSLRNLDELTSVLTANELRMSDDERLETIDRIYIDMQDKVLFLRSFNNSTTVLSVQRSKEQNDVNSMRSIYHANN